MVYDCQKSYLIFLIDVDEVFEIYISENLLSTKYKLIVQQKLLFHLLNQRVHGGKMEKMVV